MVQSICGDPECRQTVCRSRASLDLIIYIPIIGPHQRRNVPLRWLGRLESDGSFVASNDQALMHRLSGAHFEMYRPSTGLWIQLPWTTPVFPHDSEGTVVYRDTSMKDGDCFGLPGVVRRLHHRLAICSEDDFTYIPIRYLVDGDAYLDYDLIDTIDELESD
ncbi:hypothetical protein DFH09DRAFT_1215958 [Mycena vulgaris]|nr:hypothetical protein DFH09DRAFT_1215958 [Mycena vulgaris]